MLARLFRCPSDNLYQRPKLSEKYPYRYSYALNKLLVGWSIAGNKYTIFGSPNLLYPNSPNGAPRFGFFFNGKFNSIRNPSQFVLLIDQDELTCDDGSFQPNASYWNTAGVEALAARHVRTFHFAKLNGASPGPNVNTRGNVIFCDGHGGLITRKQSLSQKYSASLDPDPTTPPFYPAE